MDKRRSIQVSESCWRQLKQWALDDGRTVREVIEHLILAGQIVKLAPKTPYIPDPDVPSVPARAYKPSQGEPTSDAIIKPCARARGAKPAKEKS